MLSAVEIQINKYKLAHKTENPVKIKQDLPLWTELCILAQWISFSSQYGWVSFKNSDSDTTRRLKSQKFIGECTLVFIFFFLLWAWVSLGHILKCIHTFSHTWDYVILSQTTGLSKWLAAALWGLPHHLLLDLFKWRCLGLNLGPPACKTHALPLSWSTRPHVPHLCELGTHWSWEALMTASESSKEQFFKVK